MKLQVSTKIQTLPLQLVEVEEQKQMLYRELSRAYVEKLLELGFIKPRLSATGDYDELIQVEHELFVLSKSDYEVIKENLLKALEHTNNKYIIEAISNINNTIIKEK